MPQGITPDTAPMLMLEDVWEDIEATGRKTIQSLSGETAFHDPVIAPAEFPRSENDAAMRSAYRPTFRPISMMHVIRPAMPAFNAATIILAAHKAPTVCIARLFKSVFVKFH